MNKSKPTSLAYGFSLPMKLSCATSTCVPVKISPALLVCTPSPQIIACVSLLNSLKSVAICATQLQSMSVVSRASPCFHKNVGKSLNAQVTYWSSKCISFPWTKAYRITFDILLWYRRIDNARHSLRTINHVVIYERFSYETNVTNSNRTKRVGPATKLLTGRSLIKILTLLKPFRPFQGIRI